MNNVYFGITAAVAQSDNCSPQCSRMWKVGCSNPGRDRPK